MAAGQLHLGKKQGAGIFSRAPLILPCMIRFLERPGSKVVAGAVGAASCGGGVLHRLAGLGWFAAHYPP